MTPSGEAAPLPQPSFSFSAASSAKRNSFVPLPRRPGSFFMSSLRSAVTTSRKKPAFLSLMNKFLAKLQPSDLIESSSRPSSTFSMGLCSTHSHGIDRPSKAALTSTSPITR